jgi:hypothetical protein
LREERLHLPRIGHLQRAKNKAFSLAFAAHTQ